MRVLIRCDASRSIGIGHLVRCRNLARVLVGRVDEIVFICRAHIDGLHRQLLLGEFKLIELPTREYHLSKGLPSEHSKWLGCSEEQDFNDCIKAMDDAEIQDIDAAIVDHYGLSSIWHQSLKSVYEDVRVLVIDDLANRKHDADWLLDSNRLGGWSDNSYLHLLNDGCQKLLGPFFAPLSPEYASLRPYLPIRNYLRRVLIFFGGVDKDDFCSLALRALRSETFDSLAVDVVIGEGAPHLSEIRELIDGFPGASLHVGLPSLAGLIARADLAIGAAGTNSWERTCLGLPSIVIPVASNQVQGAEALASVGAARCIKIDASDDAIDRLRSAVLDILRSPDELLEMSVACRCLGDGYGLQRVVTALIGPNPAMRLRKANMSDLSLYFHWVNDPLVRQFSFCSDVVPLSDHCKWYEKRLLSPDSLLYVLVDSDGLPLGQIRFERTAHSPSRAVIGFSLDRLARGRGFSDQLLRLGLDQLWRCWGAAMEAYAEVQSDNPASASAFLKVGFQEITKQDQEMRCFRKMANSMV